MYKHFIHIFVLSCAKATYLVEKKLHHKLNIIERLQLRIHFSLCSHCRDYSVKAELLDKLLKTSVNDNDSDSIFSSAEIETFKKRARKKLFEDD